MATYQPPTEILPKFNEFVFNQANSPEYLDQLVVHKAGTETITGNKTITGDLIVNNTTTTISADTTILDATQTISLKLGGVGVFVATDTALRETTISGDDNVYINSGGATKIELSPTQVIIQNDAININSTSSISMTNNGSNVLTSLALPYETTLSGDDNVFISSGGATKIDISPTTTSLTNETNTITSTLGGESSNLIDATSALGGNKLQTIGGKNTITTSTGRNALLSGRTADATANLIDATGAGGGNTIRTDTGTNTITSTTGKNTLTTANTTTTANLIDATGAGGGNTIRTDTGTNLLTTTSGSNTMLGGGGGSNRMERTSTGSNIIKSATGTNTIETASTSTYANHIISTGVGGTNYIETTNGGNNRLVALGGGVNSMANVNNTGGDANLLSCSAAGGGNTLRTTTGTNLLTTTTGSNTLTSAGTSATSNLIDATAAGGGNVIRTTTGSNILTTTTGSNTLTTGSNSATANLIDATSAGGGNTIRTTTGANTITSTTGRNTITTGRTGDDDTNLIDATGTGGGNTIRTTTGKNLITSTSGLIEFTTANTTANGILIKNTDTTTGGIRIENDGATGEIVIDTASGADMTLSQGGSSKFSISGSGASQATNVSGGITTIAGTTTNIQSTSQPLTLSTTSGGKIEIKSNVLTSTGINIENTNTTTGGITIKTNGSTGDINLTSSDDVILTASSGQITLTSPIVSASTRYSITDKPLISFALTLVPQNYNTTASQLLIGYPNADIGNVNNNIRFPYNTRVVGWSVSGDTEAHSATTLRLRVGNNLSGAIVQYFNQVGSLAANALQNNSAMATILGGSSNMTAITTDVDATIPAGTRIFFYENTSATMACEMMFVIYFQQVN